MILSYSIAATTLLANLAHAEPEAGKPVDLVNGENLAGWHAPLDDWMTAANFY